MNNMKIICELRSEEYNCDDLPSNKINDVTDESSLATISGQIKAFTIPQQQQQQQQQQSLLAHTLTNDKESRH